MPLRLSLDNIQIGLFFNKNPKEHLQPNFRPPAASETGLRRHRDFQSVRPQPVLQERVPRTSQSQSPEG